MKKPRPEDIDIRTEYRRGDVGWIAYQHGLTYDFGWEFETYVVESLAQFYQSMDPEAERVWIPECYGEPIGCLALKRTGDFAQLRYFLLLPQFRGLGLGNVLMDHFVQFMKDRQYKRSFLLTESSLHAARSLYEKYGYRYIETTYTDFGLEERRYEMALG